jgi:hypothetical protein
MEKERQKFRCRCCRKIRLQRVDGQKYCGNKTCQRSRKNAWRRAKYASDPDYRLNQRESSEAWLASMGGSASYFRAYRAKRKKTQSTVNASKPIGPSPQLAMSFVKSDPDNACANSDAISDKTHLNSGRYVMRALKGANSDAFLVEISIISGNSSGLQIST